MTDYRGVRQFVMQEYMRQLEGHMQCLELIDSIRKVIQEKAGPSAWKWKMRIEWHLRMTKSLKAYLEKRYVSQKNYIQEALKTVENPVDSSRWSEAKMIHRLKENIIVLLHSIEEVGEVESIPHHVSDMMNDHQYILHTLYDVS